MAATPRQRVVQREAKPFPLAARRHTRGAHADVQQPALRKPSAASAVVSGAAAAAATVVTELQSWCASVCCIGVGPERRWAGFRHLRRRLLPPPAKLPLEGAQHHFLCIRQPCSASTHA